MGLNARGASIFHHDGKFDSGRPENDQLAQRVREKAEAQSAAGGSAVASGMAEFSAGDECFGEVFDRADKAMYGNKKMLKGAEAGPDGAGK